MARSRKFFSGLICTPAKNIDNTAARQLAPSKGSHKKTSKQRSALKNIRKRLIRFKNGQNERSNLMSLKHTCIIILVCIHYELQLHFAPILDKATHQKRCHVPCIPEPRCEGYVFAQLMRAGVYACSPTVPWSHYPPQHYTADVPATSSSTD